MIRYYRIVHAPCEFGLASDTERHCLQITEMQFAGDNMSAFPGVFTNIPEPCWVAVQASKEA